MLYAAHELAHAVIAPLRASAQVTHEALLVAANPLALSGRCMPLAAAGEMFLDGTRRYTKPEFGLDTTLLPGAFPGASGERVQVVEEVIWERPFCRLVHFRRDLPPGSGDDPVVLLVAPMSGHHATLLRGTIKEMLPDHEVFVTDWVDAREVPFFHGEFDLDDYCDYLQAMIETLSVWRDRAGDAAPERIAVIAVCQGGIPVLVTAAMMAEEAHPARPAQVIAMGSPIDTRQDPQAPNRLATSTPLAWFERNAIMTVPWPHRGALRRVYPGFLQLASFLAMNPERHTRAHVDQFHALVRGNSATAGRHRQFYDEYFAVMDLSAGFYLQTIDRVFQRQLLSRGNYRYRDQRRVRPEVIRDIALMTVEGEKDDITGRGQTEAAHRLVPDLPAALRRHLTVPEAGHYGIFSGWRYRQIVAPEIRAFLRQGRVQGAAAATPATTLQADRSGSAEAGQERRMSARTTRHTR